MSKKPGILGSNIVEAFDIPFPSLPSDVQHSNANFVQKNVDFVNQTKNTVEIVQKCDIWCI